ncbi:MAG TPA: hypothetical protein VFP22_01695, partial [Candidatus Limnocylindrales bacterium]|nr:hypothetical protein [Candidatus Limnocylindrales bacterium]
MLGSADAGARPVVVGVPVLEFLVAALVVVGLVAIIIRFLPRTASGEIVLPGIVENSIGMWAFRRMTGRSAGRAESDDEGVVDETRRRRLEGVGRGRPAGTVAEGIAGTAAIAAGAATTTKAGAVEGGGPDRALIRPADLHPVASLAARQAARAAARDAALRQAAAERARVRWQRRATALGSLVATVAVGVVIFGVVLMAPGRRGAVLGETGTPTPTEPGGSFVAFAPEGLEASGSAGAPTAVP